MLAQFSFLFLLVVHKLLQLRNWERNIRTTSIKFFPSCPNVAVVENFTNKAEHGNNIHENCFYFLAWRCNNAILLSPLPGGRWKLFLLGRGKMGKTFLCVWEFNLFLNNSETTPVRHDNESFLRDSFAVAANGENDFLDFIKFKDFERFSLPNRNANLKTSSLLLLIVPTKILPKINFSPLR